MCKKFLLILITLITLSSLTGCSLFSSDTEEQETAVAEESEGESPEESVEETDADVEESSDEKEMVASADDEEEVVDEYPDDDYGDEEETSVAAEESEPAATAAADEEPPQTQDESLYVDGEESSGSSYADSSSSVQDSYTEDSAKTFIPVRKMKKTPYTEGGVLINRLYIARDGDTLKSVAQKVYGDTSRSKDLLSWNPHFAGKGLSVGDKVYYSSPRNPQDNSAILLYYEEAGIQPSYYTAKNGESIRKVSQSLLGHPRSWMEVWATNDIESKWEMPEGAQLRYWPSGSSAAAPIQAAAPEPTQPEEEVMPTEAPAAGETAMTETAAMDGDMGAEPPVETQPMEEPPPMEEGAAAAMAQNEEPPPPPPDAAAPPPPPPPEAIPTPDAGAAGTDAGLANVMGEGDNMTMAILGGLLLLAAMILVIFIKRGRKKAYG